MMARGRFDEIELDELKSKHSISSVFEQYGYKVRGRGSMAKALCPFHLEKTPSCKVDDVKGTFHCFGCNERGDVIDALMHFTGKPFVEVVKDLGGVREQSPEDREKFKAQRQKVEEQERAARERRLRSCEGLFGAGKPIEGTHAARYLEARGLEVYPSWTFDLRFMPALEYRGFADESAEEATPLGEFPAMIAAIRDVDGVLIGVHRTYLDRTEPRKLTAPGDASRNAAKKVLGEQSGGTIALSAPTNRLAMGEGIETTRAWFQLGLGGDDISVAAAINLGNMAGGATASIAHPTIKGRRVPNGDPDQDRPGAILRPDIEDVILLGDGDSERVMTRMRLLVAARRYRGQGRDVAVHMAPDGKDFNDVWLERGGADQ